MNHFLSSEFPGTLRHAVTQEDPIWILFIYLSWEHQFKGRTSHELIQDLDGTTHVKMSNGPCITLENVSNIIIYNIYIHDCIPARKAMVGEPPQQSGDKSDEDGMSILGSRDVWINHYTLANCYWWTHRCCVWINIHNILKQLHVAS